jgi:hypothetical protein
MAVLLIIIGLLLLLFGGGCTLISVVYLFTSQNVLQDLRDAWFIPALLGLLPLAIGLLIFRSGLRMGRERRSARATPPPGGQG